MARKFGNVVRREIPSWKFIRLSSSFLFVFAAKLLGFNPKIFFLGKAVGLELFAFLAGFNLAINYDVTGRRTRVVRPFSICLRVLRLKRPIQFEDK